MELHEEQFDRVLNLDADDLIDVASDLRRQPRFELLHHSTVILCPSAFGRRPVAVVVRDLSISGVGIVRRPPMRLGEQFLLCPAGAGPKAVVCTVRHCRRFGGGVFRIGASFSPLTEMPHELCAAPPSIPQGEWFSATGPHLLLSDAEHEEVRRFRHRFTGISMN